MDNNRLRKEVKVLKKMLVVQESTLQKCLVKKIQSNEELVGALR